ncbi:MAG: ATP phosphoribosyltransferase regulatory subunit, partial [Faecalibacillus intestinalis]
MEEFKYLIPEESIDAIITNVEKLREIENHLRHVFSNYGYNEVLMPSFEYVDLYTKLDCGFTVDKMFQYINHEGKNVAMRLDFTIPLARLYANSANTGEARYSYFGKVYRKETMHKGRSSEFFQGGVELMNKPGLQGDKEVMTMIQESLPGISLKNILLELGSAKFYNRLLELVGNQRNELEDILRLRDIS